MEKTPRPSSPLTRLLLHTRGLRPCVRTHSSPRGPRLTTAVLLPTVITPFYFSAQSQLRSFCTCLCV